MTAARRILHLFVSLPVGGAENLLLSILKGLDSSRFESVVCCIRDKNVIGSQVEALGFPVIELDRLHTGGWDGKIVTALVDLIRTERIDLVHSHLYHANLYGRLAAKKAGILSIASIHNTYSKRKWHRHLVNWYLARTTSRIIAGSTEIKADIVAHDHVRESLVEIIPNSVDLSRSESGLTRAQARERLNIESGSVVLGTVGRLEEQKGHRFLIEALAQLRGHGVQPLLLLVGDGRERAALEELTHRHQLGEQVRFLGTRGDLGDLFRAMDVFVMPSLWEGLSLAMLSAMGAGLPVIATAVGGVPQVFGDDEYGISVPPGDVDALAGAIDAAVKAPERLQRMAERGAQRVRDEFSDTAMVRRLQEIYTEVLG